MTTTSGTGSAAAATSFPTAETTGVPAGTTLTDYDGPTTITAANTVIDGARFGPNQPTLNIQAANVTIRNSRFEILGYHCVSMDDSYVGTASLRLENCEFVGPWSQPNSTYDDLSCTVRGSGFSMYNCHVHGYGDGVHPDGDNIIQGCLFDNFGWSQTVGEHVDGSQSLGGTSGIHFIGNSMLVQLSQSVAGAIQFGTEYGAYDDVLLQDNLIAGGAWALYAGEDPNVYPPIRSTNFRVLNNVFSTRLWPNVGQNGIIPFWNSANQGNQWAGNTLDNGTAVPPPDSSEPTPPPPPPPPVGPYASIFTDQMPEITDNPDAGPLNLGTRFVASVRGEVAGVRFYAPDNVVGDGEVTLWDVATGDLLADTAFSGADLAPSDWNDVLFAAPVRIAANQLLSTQVYWSADNPHYVATQNFFSTTNDQYVTNGALSAVDSSGRNAHINGVFSYDVDPELATDTLRATSYFVDTLFTSGGTALGQELPSNRDVVTEVVIPLSARKFAGLEQWAAGQAQSPNEIASIAVNQYLQVRTGRSLPSQGVPPIQGRVPQGIELELVLTPARRSDLLRTARSNEVRVGQLVLESLEQYLRQNSTSGPDQLPT